MKKKVLAVLLCVTNILSMDMTGSAMDQIYEAVDIKEECVTEGSEIEESETEKSAVEESTTEVSAIEESATEEESTEEQNLPESSTEEDSCEELNMGEDSETEGTDEFDSAVETDTEIYTEDNTEFTQAQIDNELEKIRERSNALLKADGFEPCGYIDSGFEAEPLNLDNSVFYIANAEGLPSRYSALESGELTSVKNQGNWGACWAFSAVTAAENDYKRIYGKESDLSETHLINFLYNSAVNGPDGGLEGDEVIPLRQPKVNNGGNAMFTTFALARWTGVADEERDASLIYPDVETTKETNELNIPQELAYADALHLQNAYWIHAGETEVIKQQIMENGAVGASYNHDESCSSNYVDKSIYDGPTVYYNYQKYGTSHAISIVGWDDDFDKNKFAYTAINRDSTFIESGISFLPQNNGAWLVKNSWGTEYGDDGYFWMSYEDASLSDTMYAFDFERADNYDHIYQYDGSAGTKYECGEQITAAAVYKSNGSQLLEAVGVGIASVETDYKIEIYKSLADVNNPQSGQLAAVTQGHTTFQGYHTIKLDDSVILSEGEVFGVVVTLSNGMVNKESGSAIFMDKSYDNGSSVRFVAKSSPGETFIKKDGQWEDVYEEGTFRIKAYTGNYDFEIPQENISLTSQMVQEIEDQEYSGTINEPDILIGYMGERLIQNVDYIVNYVNNDHVADRDSENAPRAIITGTGKYIGVVEQTFTIVPKVITEEMIENTSFIYNGNLQNDLVITNGMARLVKDKDYSITYDKQPCNVGTYQAQIVGKGNYSGTLNVPVTIVNTMLTEDMITVPEAIEYTGKAIKPQVTVSVGGADIPASGFTVSFKNNINVGTATVTVSGKGNCQGKVQKSFQIVSKDISKGLEIAVAKVSYTGKAVTPKVTVKCNGRTLRKGTDYTATYENNRMAGENAFVMIAGKDNYTGIFRQTFTILPKELSAGSIGAEIGYGESGNLMRVLYGKTELSQTDCSTVVYRAGTSTTVDLTQLVAGEKYDVEITLKGNYRTKNGASVLKKNIVCRKSLADLTVELENSAKTFTYNGKAQKPKLIVREQSGTEVSKSNYTVSYVDNINAGTSTAVVTGKGTYAGTKRLEFTIQKQQLDNLTIHPVKDQTYAQKEICPAIKVMDGKKTLKSGAGKDYVCTYGNNVYVSYDNGNVTAGAYAEIRISDNYAVPEGTNLRVYFRILPAKISSLTLSKAYYTREAVLPDNIVIKAGRLIVPVDSCEVTADNNVNVSGSAVLKVTAKAQSNYTGSLSKKYSIVKQELKKCLLPAIPDMPYLGQPVDVSGFALKQQNGEEISSDQYTITVKNNTKPGKATVTYAAKSNSLYRGNVSIRFNIIKGTVAQAIDWDTSQAVEKPYTGKAITLPDEEIRQLAPIRAYTGAGNPPYTVTYAKNTDAGKASVKLMGKDYLHGSATVYFTITPKSVSSLKITTGDKQLSYNAGNPVYLELKKVTDGDKELKSGKDYIYSYTNADKKGTACLTVTGVGNYTGTRYIYYKIES